QWTAGWLSRHLEKEFDIKISDRYINQLLKQMGLSTKLKRQHIEKIHPNSSQNQSFLIQDLHRENSSQTEEFLSFNLLQAE
ncbi:MAG: helix-turn-helix domain-containing protein, partial [Cyanobacteria bacterium P01_G01_bin.49]